MHALQFFQDSMGQVTPACLISDSRHVRLVGPDDVVEFVVPPSARHAAFNATADIWVQYDAVAEVPDADIIDGNAPELNPAMRHVAGVTSISVAAATTCLVSVVFYG